MAHRVSAAADQVLLQALACGATVELAARKANMGERTAYRRLKDPCFLQRLEQLRADMVGRTASLLTGAGMGSVKTLVDLQNEGTVPAGVRRRAARDVLELGLKFRENTSWEQHVARLEEHVAQAVARRLAHLSAGVDRGVDRAPLDSPPASSYPGAANDQAADSTPGTPATGLDA